MIMYADNGCPSTPDEETGNLPCDYSGTCPFNQECMKSSESSHAKSRGAKENALRAKIRALSDRIAPPTMYEKYQIRMIGAL